MESDDRGCHGQRRSGRSDHDDDARNAAGRSLKTGTLRLAFLQHLNQVMYADLENSNRFVTLFYSEYDPKTRILSYSNAAHNPPLLWHASTDTIERLDTLGMLIGLDAETEYQDAQGAAISGRHHHLLHRWLY